MLVTPTIKNPKEVNKFLLALKTEFDNHGESFDPNDEENDVQADAFLLDESKKTIEETKLGASKSMTKQGGSEFT